MTREASLASLQEALSANAIAAKDKEFAESLVTQGKSRGLSERQWYWVVRLVEALTPKAPVSVADFSRVYAMFRKAKEALKSPKVILRSQGITIKLYLSTARSRVPDTINVVDPDTGRWHGRIFEDGRWEGGEASENVEAVLTQLAANPEEVAAAHGKTTGACCFCNRGLTDDRSTEVGYGPVCATRFGLGWGKK